MNTPLPLLQAHLWLFLWNKCVTGSKGIQGSWCLLPNKNLVSVNTLSRVWRDEQFLRSHFPFCKMKTVVEGDKVSFMLSGFVHLSGEAPGPAPPALLPLPSLSLSPVVSCVKPPCHSVLLESLRCLPPTHADLETRIRAATGEDHRFCLSSPIS